jgi:hypothetical protein
MVTALETAIEQESIAAAERWSVTRRVKLKLPGAEGVPPSEPAVLICIPAGRAPEAIDHW